jgi:hypothetical protein
MVRHLRESSRTTQLLLALAFACALLLRLAVPEGWMPVQSASGWRLTICSGMGPIDTMPGMTMDHGAHKAPAGGHDNAGSHVCPFAGPGLATTSPLMAPLPVIPPIFAATPLPLHDVVAIGRGLAAPPPPQTGPPAIV